ncbi:MAG: GDP-mannose 4,6-dehydratase [Candidatus Babeliaceae bacterium]
MMKKKALITGITGQDGAYLAHLLLEKEYIVHGIQRRSSASNTHRLDFILHNCPEKRKNLFLHYGDVTDSTNIIRLLAHIQPDEVYNLAAQSHVQVSFETPEYTAQADALGALRLLEGIRILGLHNTTKFYQASTSELYGNAVQVPQNEQTVFSPQSPYATAKLYAYWITVNYRTAYSFFACNGILFNHESPLRGATFVTRKITQALAAWVNGHEQVLFLGNLDAQRDWGYAPEYVEAMWRMLQHEHAEDFVIATGESHTVREFVEIACAYGGIELLWTGSGVHEKGIDIKTGKTVVAIDPTYFRPAEVHHLLGDARKAYEKLNWKPQVKFKELVALMLEHDIKAYRHYAAASAYQAYERNVV